MNPEVSLTVDGRLVEGGWTVTAYPKSFPAAASLIGELNELASGKIIARNGENPTVYGIWRFDQRLDFRTLCVHIAMTCEIPSRQSAKEVCIGGVRIPGRTHIVEYSSVYSPPLPPEEE